MARRQRNSLALPFIAKSRLSCRMDTHRNILLKTVCRMGHCLTDILPSVKKSRHHIFPQRLTQEKKKNHRQETRKFRENTHQFQQNGLPVTYRSTSSRHLGKSDDQTRQKVAKLRTREVLSLASPLTY